MRWLVVVVGLVALAGCDRVFGLGDPYEDASSTMLGSDASKRPVDVGSGTGTPPALIASFRFDNDYKDDVSGTGAICASTVGNGCMFGASHNSAGQSALFDGSTCLTFHLAARPQAVSIVLWENPNSGTSETLLSRPDGGSTGAASWKLQTDNDSIFFASDGTQLTGTPGPAAGTWHAIAVTMGPDGSVAYLDGIVRGTGTGATIAYTADSAYIACDASTANLDSFHGLIDNLQIYDGILAAADIQQLASQ